MKKRKCATHLDFLNEKSQLEIEIVKRGHECIFYPKFHCELNYIEYFWAAVKRYTQENCNYSFAELETTVIAGLESVSLELFNGLQIGPVVGLMHILMV